MFIPDGDKMDHASRLLGYRSPARYRARGEHLFSGVNLLGRSLLEVGCGRGAWAIWAALHGAKRVVGIEPEADGSRRDQLAEFRHAVDALAISDVVAASGCKLEELPASFGYHDVVVLYDVINHLDEWAVQRLHHDSAAWAKYLLILRMLRDKVTAGGTVIVADCARANLWPQLGMSNPFAPTIEWQKHQNPKLWMDLFRSAGFRVLDCRWSPLFPLGRVSSNRAVHYCTISHFVLRFRRVD
jgi:cyclopropane fatty-acyl-phospholipid synthase-like methyltransferase